MTKRKEWTEIPVEEYFTSEPVAQVVSENVQVRSCQLALMNGYVLIYRDATNEYRLADFTAWRRAKVYEMPYEEFAALPEPQAFDVVPAVREAVWRAGVFNSSLLNEDAVRFAVRFFDVDANKVIEIIRSS